MNKNIKKNDTSISKTLSWLLRHGATKEGLNLNSEGFVSVTDLLRHKSLRGRCDINDIKRIVETNNKQRFALRLNSANVLEIRANQGHTINTVSNLELKPITLATQLKNVIHGTFFIYWDSIKCKGLSRMNRNHVHFASDLPENGTVTSGIRLNSEILIYIDIKKALNDSIKFFQSTNGVILSPGNSEGVIEPKYFLKVISVTNNENLF